MKNKGYQGVERKGGQGGVQDKSKQIFKNNHQKNNRPKDGKTDNRPYNKLKNKSQNKPSFSGKPFNKFKDGNRPVKNFDSKDGKNPDNKFMNSRDRRNKNFKDKVANNPKELMDKQPDKNEKSIPADKTVNYVVNPKKLEQRLKEVKQVKNQEIVSQKQSAYQQKKSLRNDIYTQTTNRNQPLMAGRMKLLYGQLQKSFGVQE